MTTSSGLSGGSGAPRPPAKGSFPLDHLSECREFAKAYRACLNGHARSATACRREAREYLECRMQRGLMAREAWAKLGLDEEAVSDAPGPAQRDDGAPPLRDPLQNDGARAEQGGFVAGERTARRRRQRGQRPPDDAPS